VLEVLREMGAEIRVGNEDILLKAPERYRNVSVRTGPYPAFPTDLHPQLAALFCIGGRAKGRGEIRETVWQQRFRYTEELVRMGARVGIEEDRATFLPAMLSGTAVRSPDLRGGAALLLAALAASGRSEITNAATVGRGYEHLEQKLRGLGAEVRIFG